MQINRTSAGDASRSEARRTSPNVQSKPVVPAGKSAAVVSRSVLSMINSAALPVDKLSASIITFARFFSLPLKPELMADIRRQALAVPSGETAQNEAIKQTAAEGKFQSSLTVKFRDALSMSAAAAESKGVELQPKALEYFAEAADPDLRDQQKENQNNRKQNKNQNEQKEENAGLKQFSISASSLEKMALEYLEKDTLLELLNKLPGKNGQRWIVIPLDFSKDGKEYRVSLKILLETKSAVNTGGLMALDIIEAGNSKSRMSFILESSNDKAVKLSVYSQSELPAKDQKSFKRELSKIFNIPLNNVSIKTRDDILLAGCDDDLLASVDKVV